METTFAVDIVGCLGSLPRPPHSRHLLTGMVWSSLCSREGALAWVGGGLTIVKALRRAASYRCDAIFVSGGVGARRRTSPRRTGMECLGGWASDVLAHCRHGDAVVRRPIGQSGAARRVRERLANIPVDPSGAPPLIYDIRVRSTSGSPSNRSRPFWPLCLSLAHYPFPVHRPRPIAPSFLVTTLPYLEAPHKPTMPLASYQSPLLITPLPSFLIEHPYDSLATLPHLAHFFV